MNDKQQNALDNRNRILTGMSSDVIRDIILNNTGADLARQVGIPVEKLSNALASPEFHPQEIVAAKGVLVKIKQKGCK